MFIINIDDSFRLPFQPMHIHVINIIVIFSHGVLFKKNSFSTSDLNLRRRYQSTALVPTRPFSLPQNGSIKSREKQLLPLLFVHVIPHIITNANFCSINFNYSTPYVAHNMMLLIY